jgi:dTDP-4-amino-4,6-dideoxygalactose transaminase
MSFEIPFNQALPLGRELEYVREAVLSGSLAGNRDFTRRCESLLEETLGVQRALLTPSCTHALEMSSLVLGIQPGDEVIVPSFTFVSTANAFAVHGARPVFCDIRPDTLNLHEEQVEDLITPRTKAIVPIHYAGVGCEMDILLGVGERHGVPVVEDNAHGLFGRYRGRLLGTLGGLATLSFHETKNFTCGEGGAFLINDPRLVQRAEIIREKGTDRTRFFRGQVDKYTWVDVGSSFLLGDVLAAYLLAQLEIWPRIQEKRRDLWITYHTRLEGWAQDRSVSRPTVPSHCDQAYHMYYLLLPSLDARQSLIAHLRDRGILGVFHYQPLHTSRMGRVFGGRPGDCPVTEDLSDRILRLPFYNSMNTADQERVVDALLEWPGA